MPGVCLQIPLHHIMGESDDFSPQILFLSTFLLGGGGGRIVKLN